MSVQKSIITRTGYDSTGKACGATATLATGIPGERCDTAPIVEKKVVATAATKYGAFYDGGLVVNPKEGVRFGGSFADGLDIAANTPVSVATKGHYFVEIVVAAKQAIAKGAKVYADANGLPSLTENGTAMATVLEGVDWAAKSGDAAEKGAEFFRAVTGGYGVIVKVELA